LTRMEIVASRAKAVSGKRAAPWRSLTPIRGVVSTVARSLRGRPPTPKGAVLIIEIRSTKRGCGLGEEGAVEGRSELPEQSSIK